MIPLVNIKGDMGPKAFKNGYESMLFKFLVVGSLPENSINIISVP
jgi:hypothetical protein